MNGGDAMPVLIAFVECVMLMVFILMVLDKVLTKSIVRQAIYCIINTCHFKY